MKFGVQVYNKIGNLCASVVKKLLVEKKLFEKQMRKNANFWRKSTGAHIKFYFF
jgi:hypothetical protein